ncbi:MAG: CARDB domain-containing protein [Haloarculaceae archaeon]
MVVSLTAPDSAAPDSTIDVTATVENPGTTQTTESVEFRLEGTVVDRQTVTVDAGERSTVTFEVNTSGVEPGEYLHGVLTESDGAFATLTISESFTVDELDAPATATSGDNVSVTATVTNPNEDNTTQNVQFRFAGGLLAQESVTLDADESTDVTFNATLAGVAEGTYIHGVLTRDSGQLATLDVEAANDTEAPAPATVSFSDQESDGTSVVVDSATLPEGGFVTIHDSTLLDGNVVGSVIGVSEQLSPGLHENVTVELFTVPGGPNQTELTESDTLIAMPHLDTNMNGMYDFVISEGMEDGPYVDNGSAVTDAANVTVVMEEPNETAPPEMNETNETEAPGETNETETPGETNETETPGEEEPGETTPGEEEPGEATPGEEEPGEATPGEETDTETTVESLVPGPF